MFDGRILSSLATKHKRTLTTLGKVEENLRSRFFGLDDPIRAVALTALSGEPLLLIGPPGTAKSKLIRAFCGSLGLLDEQDMSKTHGTYFEYLLTPFTEPGELFGFYNIKEALEGDMTRLDENSMQKARVVYLDEVFNGSSAILNSILTFVNERIFHDRGKVYKVPMEFLFGATNNIPTEPALRAIFDRFVLRCRIDNADPRSVGNLVRSGWVETYGKPTHTNTIDADTFLKSLSSFRDDINDLTRQGKLSPTRNGSRMFSELSRIVEQARNFELSEMSNRRLVKAVHIMLVHRVYEAALQDRIPREISLRNKELMLIPKYFLDRTDDTEAVQKLEGVASNARI